MSGLISVAEALARILASVPRATAVEVVPLGAAAGRTLAADVVATRTQPPFPASAMDGYAVRAADATASASLRLVGTSAAGHGFSGTIGPGETVRIFTGAPVPEGADGILIQENARAEGPAIHVLEAVTPQKFVRRAGLDFSEGDVLLTEGDTLDARRLALAAAAAGRGSVAVRRKPRVAILATGDELVQPGEVPAWDQIVASNALALAALVNGSGGEAIDLGIAGDTLPALEAAFARARAAEADLLVTLGGASVGDHDLVQTALAAEGLELGFWRVALRPGKPLMHGHLGDMLVIGLPGNPVSSIVCGLLFVVPAVRALLGDPRAGADRSEPATLGRDLDANDGRQDYMRAVLDTAPDRLPVAHPESRQDSSMLAVLGRAEALLVRAPHAPAARAGNPCRIIRLDRTLL